ncbi:MAG TPA: L-seryl-tRNA(Sec) selenium transferase [Gemmatimonadaceae bacterium]|jgi:L-seryl-tRNA(Ser) seleniumtransferase
MIRGASAPNADPRRSLPSVNTLLEMPGMHALLERAPRASVVDAVRAVIDAARVGDGAPHDEDAWVAAVDRELARIVRPSLRPVINATGVVLHTNLGRAPLPEAAVAAIASVASGYSNLEYDIETGARGSRYVHCAALLRELTGAEDALVVNNCAAALVLALNTFADRRGAIISRGEMVEIGGSFRIPEIMERSGARLVEVGTTNRTHVDDYRRALGDPNAIGALLKVHRSNFAIEGFVAEASVAELQPIAVGAGVPIIHDLGSGLLISLEAFGLTGEPTAREALSAGATLVTMSGDKLLGGPQAGLIVGERDAIASLRRNPLARSYRVDKLTLAALEATLALYREPAQAMRDVPVLAMLGASIDGLRRRAQALSDALGAFAGFIEIADSEASVGGGAFPTAKIPSVALSLARDATALENTLRLGERAVIGRVAEGKMLLDVRTVLPRDDRALATALIAALHTRS